MTTKHDPHALLNTAVLFLVFNRPDTTKRVFEAIRKARPSRLYVAADGPREERIGEIQRVEEVRATISHVDWPCRVKRLFRTENIGCKYAVSEAIDWFFSYEQEGIILEDDCLPHPDFFLYSQWALEEFRGDNRVWHINGNNFDAPEKLFKNERISFLSLAQVWGWATWADRWSAYQRNPFYISAESQVFSKNWNLPFAAKVNKIQHIEALIRGLDTWDYQWQITILNKHGLALSPSSNLISNIGDGEDATHTRTDNRTHLPVCNFELPKELPTVALNRRLNAWYGKKMDLLSWRNILRWVVRSGRRKIERILKNIVIRIFFGKRLPVVVASTGRAGSTMVTEALSESLVSEKFGGLPDWIKRKLAPFAIEFLDRIEGLGLKTAPILKTHDLYRNKMAKSAKFIFIFGSPLDSAISVRDMQYKKGSIWVEEHIFHLAGHGRPSEIFNSDVLNYESQIKSWGNSQTVLILHYDDIWKRLSELSDFVGFSVRLPTRKTRSNKIEPSHLDRKMFERLAAVEADLKKRESKRDAMKFALAGEGLSPID